MTGIEPLAPIPPVDVIIPCWTETREYLPAALASLRTYMRPIVVFNGPGALSVSAQQKGTYAITEGYIETLGGGCYLCHARNYGVARAHSQYITFLDADDLFLPGIDDVALAARGRRGAWGDALIAYADGSEERVRQQLDPPTKQPPCTGTYVLRRDIVPAFDVWARHQTYSQPRFDWWFWQDITDVDLKYVPMQAMTYRYLWSEQSATWYYKANLGWRGVGEHPAGNIASPHRG